LTLIRQFKHNSLLIGHFDRKSRRSLFPALFQASLVRARGHLFSSPKNFN
jgi:hypothetical protein